VIRGRAAALARDAALGVALVAALVAARAVAPALPEPARLWAAWLALLVLPAFAFALPHRAARRGALDAAAIGAGEALALFSAVAFAVALGGGGLRLAIDLHPVAAGAWLVAARTLQRHARALAPAHGAGDSAAAPIAPVDAGASVLVSLESGAGAAASSRWSRAAIGGAALFVALVLIGLWRMPPPDFRMDVYDHAGAAARMADRDRILSREMGNGAESEGSDPRKGTWNSLLAAVLVIAHEDPLVTWRSATILASLIGALAFARLSREVLGRAWPLGAIFLLAAHEGGPGGAWLARSAYPGVLSLFLYALFLAETLAAVRGRRRMPYELAAALGPLHLLAGLFGFIAATTLGVLARRSAAARSLLILAVVTAIGCALRVAIAGPSTNPIHTELQGILFLGGGLVMIEPRTLFERIGSIGFLGFLAAMILARRSRHDLAAAWFVALAALVCLIVSPVGTMPLAAHLSYLLRRIPALAPLPLLAAMAVLVLLGGAVRASGRMGARRALALAAALVLLLPALRAAGDAAALTVGGERPPLRDDARESAWSSDLARITSHLQRDDRLAADPITSYALYARALASPLTLPDQHGPPTDGAAAERLATLARILSPSTDAGRRHAIATEAGVTHVLVNESFPASIPTFGYPISPEELSALREILDRDSTRFHLADRSGALSLYETVSGPSLANDASTASPILPPVPAPMMRAATSSGLILLDAKLSTTEVATGELVLVKCTFESPKTKLPVGDYFAFFSIAAASDTAGRSIAKVTRALGELRGERAKRVLFERIVGAHKPVLIWLPGGVAFEQYGLRIPSNFAPGRYAVAMDVHRLPFFQNRSLAGLLSDNDEYSRIPIGTIEVIARTEIGS
jgi:hypothetical protein